MDEILEQDFELFEYICTELNCIPLQSNLAEIKAIVIKNLTISERKDLYYLTGKQDLGY